MYFPELFKLSLGPSGSDFPSLNALAANGALTSPLIALQAANNPRSRVPLIAAKAEGLDLDINTLSFPVGDDFKAKFPKGKLPTLEDGSFQLTETVAVATVSLLFRLRSCKYCSSFLSRISALTSSVDLSTLLRSTTRLAFLDPTRSRLLPFRSG